MDILRVNGNTFVESSDLWPEFTKDVCDFLNNGRCIVVGAAPSKAEWVCRTVDRILSKLQSLSYDSEDTEFTNIIMSFSQLTRVRFTTEEHIEKLQRCTSVYGRVPMLAILEMYEDRCYVFDLDDGTKGMSEEEEEEAIMLFFCDFARGSASTALQGEAPPVNDLFSVVHDISLSNGLCAVTCTFARLKRETAGGAICVFWRGQCPVCFTVMIMLDHLVGLVFKAAGRYSVNRPFNYIVCDIDNNDLPEEDWPGRPEQRRVPTIVAYNGSGERFLFSGKRSAVSLVAFICDHCIPNSLSNALQIISDVKVDAEKMEEDEFWNRESRGVVSSDL